MWAYGAKGRWVSLGACSCWSVHVRSSCQTQVTPYTSENGVCSIGESLLQGHNVVGPDEDYGIDRASKSSAKMEKESVNYGARQGKEPNQKRDKYALTIDFSSLCSHWSPLTAFPVIKHGLVGLAAGTMAAYYMMHGPLGKPGSCGTAAWSTNPWVGLDYGDSCTCQVLHLHRPNFEEARKCVSETVSEIL